MTGWTWDYIESLMTLPRIGKLMEYWADNPPLHLMIKAYLGLGKKREPSQTAEDFFGAMA